MPAPRRFALLAAATAATAALAAGVVAPAAAAAPLVSSGSRTVFVGDYDTGDFCQWNTLQSVVQNGQACGYRGDHYSARLGDGGDGHRTAARYELRDGDVPNVPGGERSEVRAGRAGDVHEGDERWYAFSLKFDRDFPSPTGSYMVVMQWHPVTGPPPLAVEVDRSGNLIVRNANVGETSEVIGRIKRGQWVDYVLHVRFSDDPSIGFVEVAENGTTVVRRTPWRGMPTASNYLKEGLYRDKTDTARAVLWHDGLRVTAP
ncbi:heparin lyase I family protein [Pseudonocardia sp.]|uniref:heparin lyase I family protein n=1 Tax=Pseudonocardia sp. TaxID=60912 RepID=UPI003D0B743D